MTDFDVEPLADAAVLLRFGHAIDAAINARVLAAARLLRTAALAGVTDIAPAYASLLLRFEPTVWLNASAPEPLAPLIARVREVLAVLPPSCPAAPPRPAATIDVPVCYGGECGPDFEALANHAHLTRNEVIARHTAADYSVAMLGFAPGFPYLLGLDPALRMPRRANPRTRVPAGSIAIGGAQTGIYPRELPGGWQLIGRTPLVLFDPGRDPPCLLAPGDSVRFHVIEALTLQPVAARRG